jgi:Na+-transporting methylmalonyl-CoA/oxaloacetate decarboxylase gamma subunit
MIENTPFSADAIGVVSSSLGILVKGMCGIFLFMVVFIFLVKFLEKIFREKNVE